MIESIIALLAGWIVAVIAAGGYLGIVLLMAVESACIPLPSEIIMPFSGYLVSTGQLDLWLVATAGAVGCNVGSTVAYYVGRYGGRPLIERWGAYILMSRADLARADRFFARYGAGAVFIARLLPVVRTFISLPAGISGVPQLKFQIYSFLGSWPWCLLLAYVGAMLGERWQSDPTLKTLLHRFDIVIVAGVLALVALHVRRHWRESRQPAPGE